MTFVEEARTKVPVRQDLLVLNVPESPAQRSLEKKRLRRHQVLNVVRTQGPISRANIARTLCFNLPTVSSLVEELVDLGLVIEEEARPTRLGRRPIPVTLNGDAACVLGIDSGRTNTTALLMNLSGQVIRRAEHRTPTIEDTISQVDFLSFVARDIVNSGASEMPPLAGAAVALRGFIRLAGPDSPLAPMPEKVRARLSALLGVPVLVENDARVMAMSAMWFEQLKGLESFAVVNIGTGLGLGLVLNRKLYDGQFGHAGELGHLSLGDEGVPCYCGGSHCLENVASGSGIERLARARGLRFEGRHASARDVFAMAAGGSREALDIVDLFARRLALGISVVLDLFNLQSVILSGRVARSADLFMGPLQEELSRLTIPAVHRDATLIVSELKENSSPYGACAHVLQHIFGTSHVPLENII